MPERDPHDILTPGEVRKYVRYVKVFCEFCDDYRDALQYNHVCEECQGRKCKCTGQKNRLKVACDCCGKEHEGICLTWACDQHILKYKMRASDRKTQTGKVKSPKSRKAKTDGKQAE